MDKKCGGCAGDCGGCPGCPGCGGSLALTPEELEVLQVLEQTPFLPAARRADNMEPVCREPELAQVRDLPNALALLEKKGLIDLDYRSPLKGFDYGGYRELPCRGSMALTARGQRVLELLSIQGASE